MNIKQSIYLFYIIYSIYIIMVINATNITFFTILPALMLMWINYFFFSVGYSIKKSSNIIGVTSNCSNSWLLNRSNISLFAMAGFSILFSFEAVQYYTGQTPVSIFSNLGNNISLYYLYQSHFAEQQIDTFSISKIPFIFMLFYIKFFFFYSYISFFIVKKIITKVEKIYLGAITLSFVYVGIARGTNFEFFELVMMIIFISLSNYRIKKIKLLLNMFSKIALITVLMILIFYIGISARGVNLDYYISEDVSYDPNGILPFLSEFLAFITIIIYGYFGFGFFYMATYVNKLWFYSMSNFIAGLLPLGYYATHGKDLNDIMQDLLDMGAKWQPGEVLIINSTGYLGLLLFCFIIGVFAKYLSNINNKTPIVYLTGFMILLQMISLPIGNFVSISSASQLIVISLGLYWIRKLFNKVRIRL